MKIKVEMLAFNQQPGFFREVEMPDETSYETQASLLEGVFMWGQNEVQPISGVYSVSVGDIIYLNGKRFLILATGFKEMSDADYEGYLKLDLRGRNVFAYGFGDK